MRERKLESDIKGIIAHPKPVLLEQASIYVLVP